MCAWLLAGLMAPHKDWQSGLTCTGFGMDYTASGYGCRIQLVTVALHQMDGNAASSL